MKLRCERNSVQHRLDPQKPKTYRSLLTEALGEDDDNTIVEFDVSISLKEDCRHNFCLDML